MSKFFKGMDLSTLLELERCGYAGRYVLEQDTAIMGDEPAAGEGPIESMRISMAYLQREVAAAHSGVSR